jgi:imidazolonepropionase-like amidohydrolase
MNRLFCMLLVATLSLLSLVGAGAQTARAPAVVAIEHVNVVPMDRERVLANHTVVVENGRITLVAPSSEASVPAGATRVDGRGKYLIPGLADFHAHLLPGDGSPNDPAAQQFALLLANGVTTVRGMVGAPAHLTLRDRVARGEVRGPTVYAAGRPLLGNEVPTPEVAEQKVAEQHAAGYDYVKLHEGLSVATHRRAVETAARLGIPAGGHVTKSVGLENALQHGQKGVEHLDGYLPLLVRDGAPVTDTLGQIHAGPIVDHVDAAKIPVLARRVRDLGVTNTPTLALFRRLILLKEKPAKLAARPEMRYVPPGQVQQWTQQYAGLQAMPRPKRERKKFYQQRNAIVRALHEAGAKLLAGSDSPQFFLVAGFALHDELEAMTDAGLSPFAALETATRNPAESMNALSEFGTIEVGKRADMVLVDANPLDDVRNTRRISGVVVRGAWLPKQELERMLEAVAALYAGKRAEASDVAHECGDVAT